MSRYDAPARIRSVIINIKYSWSSVRTLLYPPWDRCSQRYEKVDWHSQRSIIFFFIPLWPSVYLFVPLWVSVYVFVSLGHLIVYFSKGRKNRPRLRARLYERYFPCRLFEVQLPVFFEMECFWANFFINYRYFLGAFDSLLFHSCEIEHYRLF